MKFRNKNHQAIFNSESQKLNRNDNVKMSVLYLLTADIRLWSAAKPHIRKGYIDLDSISVKKGNLTMKNSSISATRSLRTSQTARRSSEEWTS